MVFSRLMVIGKKLFLNLDVTVFWLSYTFFLWQEWNECVAKVLGVSDDAGCFFEATTPVYSFNGGDVSTHDGLGSVHYFLQSSSFLGIQVAEPGCETTSQYALHCAAVEFQESICWHTHYQGVIWQYIQTTIPANLKIIRELLNSRFKFLFWKIHNKHSLMLNITWMGYINMAQYSKTEYQPQTESGLV